MSKIRSILEELARWQGKAEMYNELWDIVDKAPGHVEASIEIMARLTKMKHEITSNIDELRAKLRGNDD